MLKKFDKVFFIWENPPQNMEQVGGSEKITFRFKRELFRTTAIEFIDQRGHGCLYKKREVLLLGDGDINAGISAIVIALSQQQGSVGERMPFAEELRGSKSL